MHSLHCDPQLLQSKYKSYGVFSAIFKNIFTAQSTYNKIFYIGLIIYPHQSILVYIRLGYIEVRL